MAEIQEMTGFQSPCAEFAEDRLSLDQKFLSNPPAMFPLKVGSDNKLFELKKGDHLIVDRSLDPKQGDLVVAVVSNNFLIAKFSRAPDGTCWLLPFNKKVGDVEAEEDFIWGVIASVHRRLIK
jgi:DNA polymerase V